MGKMKTKNLAKCLIKKAQDFTQLIRKKNKTKKS